MGFSVHHDMTVSPGNRIVQLTPLGSACSVVVGEGVVPHMPPGSVQGLQLVVPSLVTAHAQLVERGVEASELQVMGGDASALLAGPCSRSPDGCDVVAPTATAYTAALHQARSPAELPTIQKRLGPGDDAIGVRMRDLFDIAKAAMWMPLEDFEPLLTSPLYEVRMGAFCILDFRARC